mmetsp:Transcript_128315/g.363114  ORF Transcript_128315/g.363114 Transcript_128315/m.363114 type:complete len:382 (+) Transcript_128315:93-1238(+)
MTAPPRVCYQPAFSVARGRRCSHLAGCGRYRHRRQHHRSRHGQLHAVGSAGGRHFDALGADRGPRRGGSDLDGWFGPLRSGQGHEVVPELLGLLGGPLGPPVDAPAALLVLVLRQPVHVVHVDPVQHVRVQVRQEVCVHCPGVHRVEAQLRREAVAPVHLDGHDPLGEVAQLVGRHRRPVLLQLQVAQLLRHPRRGGGVYDKAPCAGRFDALHQQRAQQERGHDVHGARMLVALGGDHLPALAVEAVGVVEEAVDHRELGRHLAGELPDLRHQGQVRLEAVDLRRVGRDPLQLLDGRADLRGVAAVDQHRGSLLREERGRGPPGAVRAPGHEEDALRDGRQAHVDAAGAAADDAAMRPEPRAEVGHAGRKEPEGPEDGRGR